MGNMGNMGNKGNNGNKSFAINYPQLQPITLNYNQLQSITVNYNQLQLLSKPLRCAKKEISFYFGIFIAVGTMYRIFLYRRTI